MEAAVVLRVLAELLDVQVNVVAGDQPLKLWGRVTSDAEAHVGKGRGGRSNAAAERRKVPEEGRMPRILEGDATSRQNRKSNHPLLSG